MHGLDIASNFNVRVQIELMHTQNYRQGSLDRLQIITTYYIQVKKKKKT